MLFKHAIELDVSKPNAYLLLANILITQKRYQEAIGLYEKALKLTNNGTKIYVLMANAHMMLDEPSMAAKYYRLAMKEEPENLEIKLIYTDVANNFILKKVG